MPRTRRLANHPADGLPILYGTLDPTRTLWCGRCPRCRKTHTHSWRREWVAGVDYPTKCSHCPAYGGAEYRIAVAPGERRTRRR